MEMKHQICADSPGDLPKVAEELLKTYPSGRVFAIYGKMGAGKTTFIKAFCAWIGVAGTVNSPTFALVNQYATSDGENIFHFDFYRIKKIEEVIDIGYEDYFYSNSICLIEWPEKIETLLPNDTIRVEIVENEETGQRFFTF